ncbi:MAG: UDP-N-acetylglucosamine--N-acetylmuramyl-(pentapeptide) pyrophosphoryl-undecaprenol N-acetylglucosamine transferase, partial [Desulfobulbaceae bacterium]|nr:UDP-N-acetylglucosamine--N-acetylmuramyl-(pentapeptide) pyrophosphoryl-undecaprenol N-acetylglucosamine transferase [Desulfobulbaceae bacterium]
MVNNLAQAQSGLRVIVTGGGTGGHLFPGIAVAESVLDRFAGSKVLFVGTERLIDQKALANRRFEVTSIRSRGLKGKGLFAKLGGLLQIPFSIVASIRLIIKFKPGIVFGVGGYVTGPVVLAASLLGVATAIHEQNSVPGLANRLLGRFAQRVLLSIPGSEKYFPAKKCLLSGNPVRSELLKKAAEAVATNELSNTLLVLGGSQGAHRVNSLVVEAVEQAAGELPADFKVIHQTGLSDEKWVQERYAALGVEAKVAAFFDDMAALYGEAGLVVSRAGATSLAEMAV